MTTSTEIVKPRNPIQIPPLRLSIFDVMAPSYYNAFLYYYQRPDDGAARATWDGVMSTASLRAALEGLLSVYPVLGGMVRPVEGTAERELYVDSELDPEFGILLQEAETTLDFASIRARGFHLSKADGATLCPDNLWGMLALARPPLFIVKINRFACGSVCIAIAFNHVPSDGSGHFHAVNAWGEIARGLEPQRPELERERWLRPSPGVERLPAPIVEGEGKGEHMMELPVTVSQALWITPEKMKLLKQDTMAAEGSTGGAVDWVSTHNVATALLWRAMARARRAPGERAAGDDLIDCGFTINVRLRPHLALVPDVFFGNATLVHVTRFSFADLTHGFSLGHVARGIRSVISGVDREFVQGCIDFSHRNINQFGHLVGMTAPPNLSAMNSVMTLHSLPVYGLDFGAGQPAYVGVPNWPGADGMALFMPSRSGSTEGMVVYCMLKEEAMHRLLVDEELSRYAEVISSAADAEARESCQARRERDQAEEQG